MHKVIYTRAAKNDIEHLDLSIARRIVKKIAFFADQKDPLKFAKRLKNLELGQYRFRIGDYRVLFDIDSKGNIRILIILRIKHRKDIYDL